MIVSVIPILLVDLIGSVLMIILSVKCLQHVRELRSLDADNLIWTYLVWLCYGLAVFAVSRSIGHILKQVLVMTGHQDTWQSLSALSGSINTFTLIWVGSVTLFFERVWRLYCQILSDKQEIRTAHDKLVYLNQNLEQIVKERTEALYRTEKQIAQADKLASIGQLASGIAHEINNPLGIILGYTQLLIRNEPPDTERYSDLKTIEKHVQSCKAIVEGLLNFARTSKSTPQNEFVHLHEIIDDVIQFTQHSQPSDILIETNYDLQLPRMYLDEKKIRQVFINLIMNARHAVAQTKGRITISTQYDAQKKQAITRIHDTGYGIEKHHLKHIFDPFFTTKPTGEGTGLGLSVSYGIIKNHGGDITVESEPGKGSLFTVILPINSN